MMFLTRKFDFSAALRLRDPRKSDEENRELFGPDVALHGHNYHCEVTVKGNVDPDTGVVIHLTKLGEKLNREVRSELDRKELNTLPFFSDKNPTPENIAVFIWEKLSSSFNGMVLHRVRVEESPESAAEYYGGGTA